MPAAPDLEPLSGVAISWLVSSVTTSTLSIFSGAIVGVVVVVAVVVRCRRFQKLLLSSLSKAVVCAVSQYGSKFLLDTRCKPNFIIHSEL